MPDDEDSAPLWVTAVVDNWGLKKWASRTTAGIPNKPHACCCCCCSLLAGELHPWQPSYWAVSVALQLAWWAVLVTVVVAVMFSSSMITLVKDMHGTVRSKLNGQLLLAATRGIIRVAEPGVRSGVLDLKTQFSINTPVP